MDFCIRRSNQSEPGASILYELELFLPGSMTKDRIKEENDILAHYLPNVKKLIVKRGPNTLLPFQISQPSSSNVSKDRFETFKNVTLETNTHTIPFKLPPRIDGFSCICGFRLTERSLQIKELPGKYWMELVDCWSCHRNEFSPITQKLDYTTDGSEILGKSGIALHRGMFMIVKNDDLVELISPIGSQVGLIRDGYCKCGIQMGEPLTAAGATNPTHLKLFIGSLAIQLDDKMIVLPDERRLMISELLDIVDSQGVTVFTLIGCPNGPIAFKFISWQSKIYNGTDAGGWKDACIIEMIIDDDREGDCVVVWSDNLVKQFKTYLKEGRSLANALHLNIDSQREISVILY